MKLAFFGGVYNNYLALEAAIRGVRGRGAEELFCLGDLGAFGPHPDRVFPLIHEHGIRVVQGNYDHSIGNGLNDCQCGYTDPRDNYFAQISYDYTLQNTSAGNREFMKGLPPEIRLDIEGLCILLCHGSPRKTNEFLWESGTANSFLNKMMRETEADIVIGTHTGIHWSRLLEGGKLFANCGVLGRPENDGATHVWAMLLTVGADAKPVEEPASRHSLHTTINNVPVTVEFLPTEYDYERLASEMRAERIPEEFVETVLTGWWTTCLEVLPGKERRAGKF